MKEMTREDVMDAFDELLDALAFYADPDTYAAIAFLPDRPCGEFMDDFSEGAVGEGGLEYNRPMPGRLARETIDRLVERLGSALVPAESEGPRLVPTGTSNPSEAGFDSQAGRQDEDGGTLT